MSTLQWKPDCTQYRSGKCLHQAAPRRLFGPAQCILNELQPDPRIKPGCQLQNPYPRPTTPPPAPA